MLPKRRHTFSHYSLDIGLALIEGIDDARVELAYQILKALN